MVQQYKIGDVVTLKAGSPMMTIIDDKLELNGNIFSFNGKYKCSYFEGCYEVRRIYPQESLKSVN